MVVADELVLQGQACCLLAGQADCINAADLTMAQEGDGRGQIDLIDDAKHDFIVTRAADEVLLLNRPDKFIVAGCARSPIDARFTFDQVLRTGLQTITKFAQVHIFADLTAS